MSIEDLMKPRYKVIADYPGNILEIGTVLYFHFNDGGWGNEGCYSSSNTFPQPSHKLYPPGMIEKYPNLFKSLAWWEEREEKDLPQYVKTNDSIVSETYVFRGAVFKVLKYANWDEKGSDVTHMYWDESNGTHLQWVLPATAEEYEQYINREKQG